MGQSTLRTRPVRAPATAPHPPAHGPTKGAGCSGVCRMALAEPELARALSEQRTRLVDEFNSDRTEPERAPPPSCSTDATTGPNRLGVNAIGELGHLRLRRRDRERGVQRHRVRARDFPITLDKVMPDSPFANDGG